MWPDSPALLCHLGIPTRTDAPELGRLYFYFCNKVLTQHLSRIERPSPPSRFSLRDTDNVSALSAMPRPQSIDNNTCSNWSWACFGRPGGYGFWSLFGWGALGHSFMDHMAPPGKPCEWCCSGPRPLFPENLQLMSFKFSTVSAWSPRSVSAGTNTACLRVSTRASY